MEEDDMGAAFCKGGKNVWRVENLVWKVERNGPRGRPYSSASI
jgi:hypothetical protein